MNKITEENLEYALQRVIYNCMIIAQSFCLLEDYSNEKEKQTNKDYYPVRATIRISALIMGRNLHYFLFNERGNYRKDDDNNDIVFEDFKFENWKPDTKTKLLENKQRINKTVGHIVRKDPEHIKNTKETKSIIEPLFKEACEFIKRCEVKRTESAKKYLSYLNEAIEKLGITSPIT